MSDAVSSFSISMEQVGSYEFRVKFDKEHYPELTMDEPAPLGKDTGPSPVRILAAAERLEHADAVDRLLDARGEVARLVVTVDRREHEFDRPFGGEAFRLERIGEPKAADHEIRLLGTAAVQLALHVLPFAEPRAGGQLADFLGEVLALQIGRSDLDGLHAEFERGEARRRHAGARESARESLHVREIGEVDQVADRMLQRAIGDGAPRAFGLPSIARRHDDCYNA